MTGTNKDKHGQIGTNADGCSQLIQPSKFHRTIDGVELAKAREEKGLTQQRFADLCGWSRTYQVQLEHPGEHEVSLDTAEKIYRVFSECQ